MDEITAPLARLEHALASAARRFAKGLRAEEQESRRNFELAAVLSRLGYDAQQLADLASGRAGPGLVEAAKAALADECRHLSREARAARAGYDLNRHLAVRRALSQLDGASDLRPDATRDERRPGRELNRRFVRKRPSRRRSAPVLAR